MRAAQAWRPGTVRARACLPQQAALSRSFAALRAAPAPCRRDAHNGGARRLRCAAEVATTPQAAAEPLLCGSAALQGKRDDQEDALTVLPYTLAGGYTYAAVFDGHGGAAASRYLQERMHGVLAAELAQAHAEGPLGLAPALTAAFLRADAELLLALSSDEALSAEERLAGSTATVALARPDRVVVAHVGDSRALLVRPSGAAVELTADHRPRSRSAAEKAEAARVRASGGWVADGRVLGVLAVSRALGDVEFKSGREQLLRTGEALGYWPAGAADGRAFSADPVIAVPDVSEVGAVEPGAFLVLATDGLWDFCSSARAAAFLRDELKRNGRDAEAAARALVEHAVGRRLSDDNVAAVIVLL